MKFHHVCIFGSDYKKSMDFYVNKLGLQVFRESYSRKKDAKKIELYCNGEYIIELFVKEDLAEQDGCRKCSFRPGLEHLSFLTENVQKKLQMLKGQGVSVTEVREDAATGKPYGFCYDPDGTKIEFYEE